MPKHERQFFVEENADCGVVKLSNAIEDFFYRKARQEGAKGCKVRTDCFKTKYKPVTVVKPLGSLRYQKTKSLHR